MKTNAARTFRRSSGLLAAAAAVVAIGLSGCASSATTPGGAVSSTGSSSWDGVVAAAQQEGSVVMWVGGQLPQNQALATAFEKAYPGITVTVVRYGIADALPKLQAQVQAGSGDADLWVGPPLTPDLNDALVPPTGPDVTASPVFVKDQPYIPAFYTVQGLLWNTDALPGGLKSYKDLLDPKLANGRIGAIEPKVATYVAQYQYLLDNFGQDFYDKFAAQKPTYYNDTLSMTQALVAGEIDAAAFAGVNQDLVDAGAPVDWAFPSPAFGFASNAYIMKTAQHPNAAQLLVDFISTPAGQEPLAKNYASVLTGIPGTVAEPSDLDIFDLTAISTDQVKTFGEEWAKTFK